MLGTLTKAFSKDYFEEELEWALKKYGSEQSEVGSACIKTVQIPTGIIHSYLHRDFRTEVQDSVGLFINNKIWMSITPLEVQSHYMPIRLAEGIVGVGGLGLGYYVNRILESSLVDEVHVYELNQDVIDLYIAKFGIHEKLTIHKQDVLEVKNENFTFFYMDIYETLLADDVYKDMAKILRNNDILCYHFWGMEELIVALLNAGILCHVSYGDYLYKAFISELISENRVFDFHLNGHDVLEELDNYGLVAYFLGD